MLIPKLLLSGIAGITGISCLAPLTIAIEANKDPANVWRVSSRSSFPLFICKNDKASILISLRFKDGNAKTLEDNKELIFEGFEQKRQVKVDFDETIKSGSGAVQLIIWKDTGNSGLGELGGEDSHNFGDNFKCGPSIFEPQEYPYSSQWEKGFNKIGLTLTGCKDNNKGQKECGIKISDEAKLKWKESFTPKVII